MTLACIAQQNFCVIRGEDLTITVPVTDTDGADVDLTTATVIFGVSRNSKTAYSSTLPTTKAGNVITATLTSTLSTTFRAGTMYYSVWVDIGSDQGIAARGNITVQNDSRVS